jgi:regulatory protein RepA
MASSYRHNRPVPKRATIDPATLTERWLAGFRADEADLWDRSPIRPPSDWREDGRCLIETLYTPGELVNIVTKFELRDGKAVPGGVGETLTREEWLAGDMPQSEAGGWLRMNPVDGLGVGDKNVTGFRFALVEFDDLPLELQLSALARLPLPIAALLTSGRRSIHAWIRADEADLEHYKSSVARMLGLLAKFGVDPANKNPSRLSRLPGGLRTADLSEPGKQRVLYLNPSPFPSPIFP